MVEVVVDQKPMPQNPVDPNVAIPESVKRRAAAVDALYAQNGSAASSHPVANPVPEQLPLPMGDLPVLPVPGEAPPSNQAPVQDDESLDGYKRKFLRMQGQYVASQKTIGEMQEQMNQLGSELLRAQQIVSREPPPSVRAAPLTQTYLTEKDVQEYGTDLVDFTQRAAVQAITPHLQSLSQQNEYLQERLARETRRGLDQRVELAVPSVLPPRQLSRRRQST